MHLNTIKTIEVIGIALLLSVSQLITAQNLSNMGVDNLPLLNDDEASRLNTELSEVRKYFDFKNKKVGFAKGMLIRSKNDYFEESKRYLDEHNFMKDRLIVLNEDETLHTNGYHAIIISYLTKENISEKYRAALVRKFTPK